MKIENSHFVQKFKVPANHRKIKTSTLLENGLFCFFLEPGVPFYMPIGKRIVDKIERIFSEEAEKLDISQIDFPLISRNDTLERGEKLGNLFRSKTLFLQGDMKKYHVLTTPEPIAIELASKSLQSYKQLPFHCVYHVEVCRAVNRPDGILKGRQFKTFMGHSLDESRESADKSLEKFEKLTDSIFSRLGIKTKKIKKDKEFNLEYFYLCPEGDNLELDGLAGKRVKSLSLAMAYHYAPTVKLWARFRNKENSNSRPIYLTYGLGTQRVFYAALDMSRDELGFNISNELRPFELSIIPMNRSILPETDKLYTEIGVNMRCKTLYDNRQGTDWGEKAKFADYISIPMKIVANHNEFIIKNRGGKEINRIRGLEQLLNFLKLETSLTKDSQLG